MYDKKLVKIGRLTMLFAIIANFLPAVYVGVRYGEMPDIATIGKLWLLVASAYGISWIVQPIAYFATLGTAGSYIGWLAGSVGDIRLPAASMAQKVVGVEPGTHEGDVIGTIGTACSVFVSAGMITLFIAIGSYVVPNLPQFVTDSFNNILPALFGAIYVDIARKDRAHRALRHPHQPRLLRHGQEEGRPERLIPPNTSLLRRSHYGKALLPHRQLL